VVCFIPHSPAAFVESRQTKEIGREPMQGLNIKPCRLLAYHSTREGGAIKRGSLSPGRLFLLFLSQPGKSRTPSKHLSMKVRFCFTF